MKSSSIGRLMRRTNPVYAGAYVYGKTRTEMTLDASGVRRKRVRLLPRDHWQVLIKEHHEVFIDWQAYEANQPRLCWSLRLWQVPNGDDARRLGRSAEAGQTSAARS